MLDCRPLSQVSLNGSTVTIGSGAALASVYDTIGGQGRAIAAGSCATVGIAGLTLGGGVGVLTRAMGLDLRRGHEDGGRDGRRLCAHGER